MTDKSLDELVKEGSMEEHVTIQKAWKTMLLPIFFQILQVLSNDVSDDEKVSQIFFSIILPFNGSTIFFLF